MESMKAFRYVLCVLVLASIFMVPMKTVQATVTPLTTCLGVQNLEATTADITINFYSQTAGEAAIQVPDTILANEYKTFCNLSSLPSGFNGSAVISSSTRLGVIANVANTNYSGMYGSYGGFSDGSQNISLPVLMKSNYGYNTEYSVQNVGTASTDVTVTYSDGVTLPAVTIESGRSHTFSQASESHVAGWVGSGTASAAAGGLIVAAALETNEQVMFAYNSFNNAISPHTNPVFPLIQANSYGYISGMGIQNTSGTATTVTVTYTPASASYAACTETKSVPANGSALFALNAWSSSDPDSANNTCVNGATFVGSGRVTSNSTNAPLVAVVNQLNGAAVKGAAYDSFNPDLATSTVVFPLIMDRNYGFFTGTNIVNVGTGAVDVTCVYSGVGSSYTGDKKLAMQPGDVASFVQLNKIANGYVGSAVCTATGTNPKIIGVANQVASSAKDTFLAYEGINN